MNASPRHSTTKDEPCSTASVLAEGGHAMQITVNDSIHLSEFRPTDQAACVEHFKEKEIYDRTLRIPYPYTEDDFQEWLAIVEKATKQQGQQVHWAIRDEKAFLIGGCGFD